MASDQGTRNLSAEWIVVAPKRTVLAGIREFWSARQVLIALVRRDINVKYRSSIFGFGWAIAKPLMQLAIFYLVIGQFLGTSKALENYSLFIFVGIMVWGFISESAVQGSRSITSGAGLVTKVSFPREILPASAIMVAGFNFLVQLPVLVLAYFLTGATPNWHLLPILILVLFSAVALGFSLALVFSALNVYARDVEHLVELLTMLLMYFSPILYSWTFVHDLLVNQMQIRWAYDLYLLNPVALILIGAQDVLWAGNRLFTDAASAPLLAGQSYAIYIYLAVAMSVLVLTAYKIFLKLEPNFAREL